MIKEDGVGSADWARGIRRWWTALRDKIILMFPTYLIAEGHGLETYRTVLEIAAWCLILADGVDGGDQDQAGDGSTRVRDLPKPPAHARPDWHAGTCQSSSWLIHVLIMGRNFTITDRTFATAERMKNRHS